jgi:NAD(P)-dependent dehydrogenase (short-subunit alcohol dehydrogenase family)
MGDHGRVAVVTGAGSGIGRAAALALADDGYRVVLAGRRLDRLTAVAAEAGLEAERGLCVATDVTDEASVEALFARTREALGRVDVLFNNAGRSAPAVPFEELSFADWKAVIDVNLHGMFLCARAAVRAMKAQQPRGGRIINNGSLAAYVPRPHSAAYAVSKHAVTGLTRSLSLDCRGHGIACGQIDVGNALTELSAKTAQGALQPSGRIEPEPMMDAAHVGRAVAHMASLPLDANVLFMTIMANGMPFVGRG